MGPSAAQTDDAPNPFLDYRLDVTFTRPTGASSVVPGFFDGDGAGGPQGDVWKVRLTPDMAGAWTWSASFRQGVDVAVDANPLAGTPGPLLDGLGGDFSIAPKDPNAPGFLSKGTLGFTDDHYMAFPNGERFLKGGTNSPENFLAYRGFLDVQQLDPDGPSVIHRYATHQKDWSFESPEMPITGDVEGRAIFGALTYLESVGVNSLYFLPMNLGGDGQDTAPFVGYQKKKFDKTHYHVGRLLQWNAVFEETQRRGLHLQLVLAETELANEQWLDNGVLGIERKLFYRELVARFAHHPAIKWNLSEENDFPVQVLKDKAAWLSGLDAYHHPVAVHNKPGDYDDYNALLGEADFDATSIQYAPDLAGSIVEQWRANSAAAGRPWILDMDENTPASTGLSDTNAVDLRKRVLYDVYFSGGQVEWYLGFHSAPLGGDTSLENFRTREEMWLYMQSARAVLSELPFWKMVPRDDLVTGEAGNLGGAEVLAAPGEAYAIYYPVSWNTGLLDLEGYDSRFRVRWFHPSTGTYAAETTVDGPGQVDLGLPPHTTTDDWVAIVDLVGLWTDVDTVSLSTGGQQQLNLRGGPSFANELYLVLGSATGSTPGFDFNSHVHLDLIPDIYTWFTAKLASRAVLQNTLGVFDSAGRATAAINIPPATDPTLAGTTLWHAWIAGTPIPTLGSNTVTITLVP